jgi:hypothetical protein
MCDEGVFVQVMNRSATEVGISFHIKITNQQAVSTIYGCDVAWAWCDTLQLFSIKEWLSLLILACYVEFPNSLKIRLESV